MIYLNTSENYDIKVEVGKKVEFPRAFTGSSASNIECEYPMTVEEYESMYISSSFPVQQMPLLGRFDCSGLDSYKTLSGESIDIDNYYVAEDITIRCIFDE